MEIDEVRTEFLTTITGVKDEDLEDTLSKFILEYPDREKNTLLSFAYVLSQFHEQGTKNFDGMRKLKVLIALNNLGSDLDLYDQVISSQYRNISLSYYYEYITKSITKIFKRVSIAAKYSRHNHSLEIKYTSKLKEK